MTRFLKLKIKAKIKAGGLTLLFYLKECHYGVFMILEQISAALARKPFGVFPLRNDQPSFPIRPRLDLSQLVGINWR